MLMLVLLSVSFGSIIAEPIRFEGHKVVEVIPTTKRHLHSLHTVLEHVDKSEVDIWRHPSSVGRPVHVCLSPKVFDKYTHIFKTMGLAPMITIDDIQNLIDEQQRTQKPKLKKSEVYEFDKYLTYDEINDWMKNITNSYPQMAELFTIATSYEKRDIYAIKISTGPEKPGFFMQGGIHAREWISPATVIYMTGQLLENYDSDPAIKEVVDKFDWYILPVLNVDGYVYTFTTNRMWRKTRSVLNSENCIGTDPNRNWALAWGETPGASDNPCSDTFFGSRPFSEIEVSDVADFLASEAGKIQVFIDFHSYSELWMTPWGYTKELPLDYPEIISGATVAIEALEAVHGTQYSNGSIANIIYVATGGSVDWTYAVADIKYSYAVELRDKGQYGFLLPPEQIIPSGEETLASVIALANHVSDNLQRESYLKLKGRKRTLKRTEN